MSILKHAFKGGFHKVMCACSTLLYLYQFYLILFAIVYSKRKWHNKIIAIEDLKFYNLVDYYWSCIICRKLYDENMYFFAIISRKAYEFLKEIDPQKHQLCKSKITAHFDKQIFTYALKTTCITICIATIVNSKL